MDYERYSILLLIIFMLSEITCAISSSEFTDQHRFWHRSSIPGGSDEYEIDGARFISIGCWKDEEQRAVPSLEGAGALLMDQNYKERDLALFKCARSAMDKGFRVFSVENGGQCFSSKDSEMTYNKYGPSENCKPDGKGGTWSAEVYRFTGFPVKPINGNYTLWSRWRDCSQTCGGGTKVRRRLCANPPPQHGGKSCQEIGPAEQLVPCNLIPCPATDTVAETPPKITNKQIPPNPPASVPSAHDKLSHDQPLQKPTNHNIATPNHDTTHKFTTRSCICPKTVCQSTADLGFVIDGSSSNSFKGLSEFVEVLGRGFKSGATPILTSVMLSAHAPQVILPSRAISENQLASGLSEYHAAEGPLNLGAALAKAKSSMFNKPRERVPRVIVVLSASSSADEVDVPAFALKSSKVRIFTVGFERKANIRQLIGIASEPKSDHVFHAFFDSMIPTADELIASICKDISGRLSVRSDSCHCEENNELKKLPLKSDQPTGNNNQTAQPTTQQQQHQQAQHTVHPLVPLKDKFKPQRTQPIRLVPLNDKYLPQRTDKVVQIAAGHQNTNKQKNTNQLFLNHALTQMTAGSSLKRVSPIRAPNKGKIIRVKTTQKIPPNQQTAQIKSTNSAFYPGAKNRPVNVLPGKSLVKQSVPQLQHFIALNVPHKPCLVDLGFMIDGSLRVNVYDKGNFKRIKEFVKRIAIPLPIGPHGTHVGAVVYGTKPYIAFPLNHHYAKKAVEIAIDRIQYPKTGTNTGRALEFARSELFGKSRRSGVPQVLIALTVGSSLDDVHPAAAALRMHGITVFSVGMGPILNKRELDDIATKPDTRHVMHAEFAELNSYAQALRKEVCAVTGPGKVRIKPMDAQTQRAVHFIDTL